MFEEFIGLTEVELSLALSKENKSYRIVEVDGSPCVCTRDYITDRLNVKMKNSMVHSVSGWG